MVIADIDRVVLSVDVVCFSVEGAVLRVLLVRRTEPPFAGSWALPGGVLGADEPLDAAAGRILAERTGVRDVYLEQLYTFGDPGRDPRGRTVSVAYFALLSPGEHPIAPGRGAAAAAWHVMDALPPPAFDHARIASYARQRLGQKLDYAPLAFKVLPETFTMGDLRGLHEAVLGTPLHPSNFVRQMLARWDLAPVIGDRDRRTRRPARLYRYIGKPEIPGAPNAERGGDGDDTDPAVGSHDHE